MTTYQYNKKVFVPVPPMKGSFPLDHDGLCKRFMLQYLLCLEDSQRDNAACRQAAKEYFQCRMQNQLMTEEDWKTLGYGDLGEKGVNSKDHCQKS